ncbi:DUF2975 domain-containing protein [Bowmanella yangjiangensis]|uniref:DUF2975 domain-containing protein n=1 Tax=Bowmanella yangjiangensis TaxID=2811230 RepID=A0ABS3CRS9_9ALTE|nr:DUF2975 domain-containing protein [Bowmanella yangjiangensis]MBN7819823.1 DUF2975 domain-containing protein [Bowmanella yangjiangensis]
MSRHCSMLIAWGCMLLLVIAPAASIYYLFDLGSFAHLARQSLNLPIQWQSVVSWQWYGVWGITVLYLGVGLVGLHYLRRAFSNFARGELFTLDNSRYLRVFAVLLLIQAVVKPLHFALSSLLLSWNHPPGQKVLSFMLGSAEVKVLVLAMILWVMSDLLVKGCQLDNENKQFV